LKPAVRIFNFNIFAIISTSINGATRQNLVSCICWSSWTGVYLNALFVNVDGSASIDKYSILMSVDSGTIMQAMDAVAETKKKKEYDRAAMLGLINLLS
jgi:hypothetical protein